MAYTASNPEGPLAASTTLQSFMKFCGYAFPLAQIPLHFLPGIGSTIDIGAHAGGAVIGLFGAMALKARLEYKEKQQRSAKNTIIKAPP